MSSAVKRKSPDEGVQNLESVLSWLIEHGKVSAIATLIGEHPELAFAALTSTKSRDWPITYAARLGQTKVVEWLVRTANVPVDAFNISGATSLFVASEAGHFETVRWLIREGADVKKACMNDASPLIIACENSHFLVAKYLIVEGHAQIDHLADDGDTALCAAARNEDVSLVELLIRAGANVNHIGNQHDTPLHNAARVGTVEIVHILVNSGANVNAQGGTKETPLDYAAHRGSMEIVRYLVNKAKASLIPAGALYNAATKGHVKVAQLLVSVGSKLQNVNIICSASQGILRSALDKINLKHLRHVFQSLGWDATTIVLVCDYSMISWTEAEILITLPDSCNCIYVGFKLCIWVLRNGYIPITQSAAY